ncbi:MBL fold metallo-hydrolase [Undibacterium sp. Ji83W]|uniref:MBL fold metallo-hydrolase n=1 Tax=Undibacterium sp. Ji83W TaxID=3413043 RepID=UPI003BF1040F
MNAIKIKTGHLLLPLALLAGQTQAASLQAAADALNAANTQSVSVTGTGKWFQFGQAPAPSLAWPEFDVSSYKASINYDKAAARVQIARLQTVDPKRARPTAAEQKPDQYVSGALAWNATVAANGSSNYNPQRAALEERRAEIWSTPHGFIKAALANNATSKALKGGVEVSFNADGKYRYVGFINKNNQLEQVKTWIDNPVLGDAELLTKFSQYKDFGGQQYPAHIVRSLGGHPVLDLQVAELQVNAPVDISAPAEVVNATAPVITVTSTKLADGVYHLTGGTHNSVAIEQADHIVIVEAPLSEERSLAVIAKAKEIIPGKPIKYLINTHAHFDHSGGLRTYVDEGAIIVTHQENRGYYQKIWANQHSLNPDRLALSKTKARFDTFKTRHVLNDGKRAIEIYPIAGNTHNDAFALVYLPAEKILVEADAYNPPAANAPALVPANPYSVNLYDNLRKLKLDVDQIAGLHGQKAVKLADLQSYIGVN